jgi:hypothetical protein
MVFGQPIANDLSMRAWLKVEDVWRLSRFSAHERKALRYDSPPVVLS